MRSHALVMLAAAAACAPVPPPAPPQQQPAGCELGPVIPASPGAPVAGYPVKDLDPATLAARRAAIAAKVPGWTVEVDPLGVPSALQYPLPAVDHHDDPTRTATVRALLEALRPELGLGAYKLIELGNGNWQIETDTPDERHVAMSAMQVADPAPHIAVTIFRVIPPPLGLPHLTPADLQARWQAPHLMVQETHFEEGHPCDPVHSASDCAGAGPRQWDECVPVGDPDRALLVLASIHAGGEYRWVIQLAEAAPCKGPLCTQVVRFPPCTDAITGESLAPSVCGW